MRLRLVLPAVLAAPLLAACSGMAVNPPPAAETHLMPTQGNTVSGFVRLVQTELGVKLDARVHGLTPGGHGIHVHEKGDCSAPDGSSAGGHFNPTGQPHGSPEAPAHHLGDLPMLVADAGGRAELTTVIRGATLGEDRDSLVGRSIIVHASADDFVSQPAGNSGARQACGVIRRR